jgi:DNA-binding HxlR family transcriptional regulator
VGEAQAREESVESVTTGPTPGLAGVPGLADTDMNRLIHERVRLGIISALAVNETLAFNDLKALLDVTDGNLSAHARKLEDAGYLVCSKGYDGRVPRTEYRITADGRAALDSYLQHMEALIRAVRE